MLRKATTLGRPPRTTSGVSAPALDPVEELYTRGVTDGLPVVPPTRERVQRALDRVGRPADELIARVPPNYGRATVEKIAVNAVMAGCRPEGSAGRFSAVVAGWSFSKGSNLVMRRIR